MYEDIQKELTTHNQNMQSLKLSQERRNNPLNINNVNSNLPIILRAEKTEGKSLVEQTNLNTEPEENKKISTLNINLIRI